jgi:hypothetical protein
VLHSFTKQERILQQQLEEQQMALALSSSSKLSKRSSQLLGERQEQPIYMRATALWQRKQQKLAESRQASRMLVAREEQRQL